MLYNNWIIINALKFKIQDKIYINNILTIKLHNKMLFNWIMINIYLEIDQLKWKNWLKNNYIKIKLFNNKEFKNWVFYNKIKFNKKRLNKEAIVRFYNKNLLNIKLYYMIIINYKQMWLWHQICIFNKRLKELNGVL